MDCARPLFFTVSEGRSHKHYIRDPKKSASQCFLVSPSRCFVEARLGSDLWLLREEVTTGKPLRWWYYRPSTATARPIPGEFRECAFVGPTVHFLNSQGIWRATESQPVPRKVASLSHPVLVTENQENMVVRCSERVLLINKLDARTTHLSDGASDTKACFSPSGNLVALDHRRTSQIEIKDLRGRQVRLFRGMPHETTRKSLEGVKELLWSAPGHLRVATFEDGNWQDLELSVRWGSRKLRPPMERIVPGYRYSIADDGLFLVHGPSRTLILADTGNLQSVAWGRCPYGTSWGSRRP